MPTPPRLYLIDGSSQMYRAYHAIRGLTGPDGKSDQRRVRLRDDAAQADQRSPAAVHRGVVRSRRADVPRRPRRPTTRPTARRCRAISPSRSRWVHEACEAMGVPILTSKRFEADDVIGTLATKAAAAGLRGRDRDRRQGLLPARPRRHQGLQPEGRRHLVRRRRRAEKFGVRPEQVVDVLALMGDSIDNIKGVPGIGEKGARDLIATYGIARSAARAAAEVSNKRYREGLLGHAEDARQSRELARIRIDVPGRRSIPRRCATAAVARALLRAVLAAGIPHARRWTSRRRRRPSARTTRSSTRSRRSRRWRRELRAAGRFALRVLPRRAVGDARVDRRAVVLDARRGTARYVPLGGIRASASTAAESDRARRARRASAGARGSGDRQDRPRSEVRRASLLARHGVDARGLETDTMIASYLVDATRSSIRSRTSRSSTRATRR